MVSKDAEREEQTLPALIAQLEIAFPLQPPRQSATPTKSKRTPSKQGMLTKYAGEDRKKLCQCTAPTPVVNLSHWAAQMDNDLGDVLQRAKGFRELWKFPLAHCHLQLLHRAGR